MDDSGGQYPLREYAAKATEEFNAFFAVGTPVPEGHGKCVYIAGPMRGISEFNFPAFDAAASRLGDLGYCVHSPAQRDRDTGFDPTGLTGKEDLAELDFDLGEALVEDADMVRFADEIYMLRGWLKSSGAQWELHLAQMLGKKVTYEQ